jgi:hypothetical protein
MDFKDTNVRRHLYGSSHVNMAVIGGGPGSEALGVAMLADEYARRLPLNCLMCSPQAFWQPTWEKLERILLPTIGVHLRHFGFDLTAAPCEETVNVLRGAGVFFFMKVLSEVKDSKPTVEGSLASLFAAAASGSHFVFIDNIDIDVYPWFDAVLQRHLMTVEHSEVNPAFRILDGEQKDGLMDHIQEIDGWHMPMMEAKLAIRLAIKP